MLMKQPGREAQQALQEVLGYLNFSSGATDAQFFRNLNCVFRHLLSSECRGEAVAANRLSNVRCWLQTQLAALAEQGGPFADTTQAASLLTLCFDHLLPAYREYHRDLLFHLSEEDYAQPFLLGRMFESILQQGPPWEESERIVAGSLEQLCDYIGYRPVAVLENGRHMQPYPHEFVQPVAIYLDQAGVAVGRYEALVKQALEILGRTDSRLLEKAWFDLSALEELAYDPRAYDFDHPANKRPNYHFGTWDLHRIDNRGRYRRFIVQQVTLDALLSRVERADPDRQPRYEYEAAAVLAGTMLMASGTCGGGPDTHDSSTSLATLLPWIAQYRDEFYDDLLSRMQGEHALQLRQEADQLRQPFGGARQHLNHQLAKIRAIQLQHVHLAQLYARMGYPEAATSQVRFVQVASARMLSEIFCRLTLAHRAIEQQRLEKLPQSLREIRDLLQRAIECGAVVDPWNIVGFGGNFSLFPAVENSVHDYRVDTLIDLVEQVFVLEGRAWSEAAARDAKELEEDFSQQFSRLAAWWDQFGASTVSDVKRLVGKEVEISTNLVAGALSAWHKAGAASGDIGFWRMFVEQFDSPRAFQIVLEALLEKEDRVASLALLMQWLSQCDRIPLEDGESSFHRLALRWMNKLEEELPRREEGQQANSLAKAQETWPLVAKFFDYLEANAEHYWGVPRLALGGDEPPRRAPDDAWFDDALETPQEDEDDQGHLFSAAYEEMTFQDSTADGFEGEMLEFGFRSDDEQALEHESQRINAQLAFLTTVARLWKRAAIAWGGGRQEDTERRQVMERWRRQSDAFFDDLLQLLQQAAEYPVPKPSGSHDSMLDYDRRRMVKESLMERIIVTTVRMADASQLLSAVGTACDGPDGGKKQTTAAAREADRLQQQVLPLLRSVVCGQADKTRALWPQFLRALSELPILYVPLARGGSPRQIVAARRTQKLIRNLLSWLPQLGLIHETCQLLRAAQEMESRNPVGAGAVTEYDRLFEIGHKAIIESVVAAAQVDAADESDAQQEDLQLVECLQRLTETQLKLWLQHSRTLRLSVVEKLNDQRVWKDFVEFVQQHCGDLLTQRFLNLGSIRSILHQGVEQWLHQMEKESDQEDVPALVAALDDRVSRSDAVRFLTIALEAVVENYGEYRDYNSTTTQSDRGEMFFMLIDFLRLRADYDRVAWKLRPVVLAHEILVRREHVHAAEHWRRRLTEQTADIADQHWQKLIALEHRYGMRLPSISDRIGERFVQPLTIDRIRALVRPAMDQARAGDSEATAFSALADEVSLLTEEPSGAGYEVPAWLASLEEEVNSVQYERRQHRHTQGLHRHIPHCHLSLDQVQQQLELIDDDQQSLDL